MAMRADGSRRVALALRAGAFGDGAAPGAHRGVGGLRSDVSEVGAIIIVGGNIAGYTRTMTTAIALETSEGTLAFALGLGLVLIGISTLVSAGAFVIAGRRVA